MLSPSLARWISGAFEDTDAYSADYLGFREAEDLRIAEEARRIGAILLTKDADFADEARRNGGPPVIWVRTSNTATRDLKPVLLAELPDALGAIRGGATLVEIGKV